MGFEAVAVVDQLSMLPPGELDRLMDGLGLPLGHRPPRELTGLERARAVMEWASQSDGRLASLQRLLHPQADESTRAAYLRALHEQHHYLAAELASPVVELTELFVDLRARSPSREDGEHDRQDRADQERLRSREASSEDRWQARRALTERKLERQRKWHSEAESIRVLSQKHPILAVLGDPGCGKTTQLKVLALRESSRLPIFASLKDYQSQEPLAFLAEAVRPLVEVPVAEVWVKGHLAGGRCLLLLDGFDEVDPGFRRDALDRLSPFLRKEADRGNCIVLTSRVHGAPENLAALARVFYVVPLSPDDADDLTRRWLQTHRQVSDPEQKAHQLLAEMRGIPGVEQLMENPLMLTMLIELADKQGGLPRRRGELYDQYLDHALHKWLPARLAATALDGDEAQVILRDMALWLLEKHRGGIAKEKVAREFIRRQHKQPSGVLEALLGPAGLLTLRAPTEVGFRHRTFLEYLAAESLGQLDPEECWSRIQPHLHDDFWQEPIKLLAANLGNEGGDDGHLCEFVHRIRSAGSPLEDVLHRDLVLAAHCVGEGAWRSSSGGRLVRELEALLDTHIGPLIKEALEALGSLARLTDGRHALVPEARAILARVIRHETDLRVGTHHIALTPALRGWWRDDPNMFEAMRSWVRRELGIGNRHARLTTAITLLYESPDLVEEILDDRIGSGLPEDERLEACAVLGLRSPRVRSLLKGHLDAPWVQWLIGGLAERDPAIMQHLLLSLRSPEPRLRNRAAEALGKRMIEDPHLVELFKARRQELIDAGETSSRDFQLIVDALTALPGGATQLLMSAAEELRHPSAEARRVVIDRLNHHARHHAEIRALLRSHLEVERDSENITRALRGACDGMEPPEARELVRHLDDLPGPQRRSLLDALRPGSIRSALGAKTFAPFLDDQRGDAFLPNGAVWRVLMGLVPSNPDLAHRLSPLMRAALTHPRGDTAYRALSQLRPDDIEALDLLELVRPWVSHPDPNGRVAAARALPTAEVDLLWKLADDPETNVQGWALPRLSEALGADPRLVPLWSRYLQMQQMGTFGTCPAWLLEPEHGLREMMLRRIERVMAHPWQVSVHVELMRRFPEVLEEVCKPAFEEALRQSPTSEYGYRRWFVEPLVELAQESGLARQVVQRGLDGERRIAWLVECVRQGVEVPRWSETLRASLNDPLADLEVRLVAARTFPEEGRHILAQAVEHEEPLNRWLAVLGLAPTAADPASFSLLVRLLDDPVGSVRFAAGAALAPLIAQQPELFPRLAPLLEARSPPLNELPYRKDFFDGEVLPGIALPKALAALAERDDAWLDQLADLLRSPSEKVRTRAADAAGLLSLDRRTRLIEPLTAALFDDRGHAAWYTRLIAARALVNDPDRVLAARALLTIGGALNVGTDPLHFIDEAPSIRKAALEALADFRPDGASPQIEASLREMLVWRQGQVATTDTHAVMSAAWRTLGHLARAADAQAASLRK